ncbi:MAG: TlpA disulfide reductase family protein [Chitinophagaceae bacterium]
MANHWLLMKRLKKENYLSKFLGYLMLLPCKQEIKNIKEIGRWQKQVDFNYMTVSIDDSRATAMVKTYAKAQGWTFPTYVDPNSDLKRSLNFQNVPFTIIVDQEGKIIYSHTGYEEGGEDELFAKIVELNK